MVYRQQDRQSYYTINKRLGVQSRKSRKKANELAFKTMYFEKGSLKNSEAFKDAQTLLRGYEPDANSFAPLKD